MFKKKPFPVENTMPESDCTKVKINVGAGLDVPTGEFMQGIHGEHVLNGGLGFVEGTAGKGNNFKTTSVEWKMFRAAARVSYENETNITTFDTEENKEEKRITKLYQRLPEFKDRNLFLERVWTITGKSKLYGDQWFDKLKEMLEQKIKHSKDLMVETPFLDRDGKTLIKILQPTFSLIDSFSEFETSDVAKILEDTSIGDKEANTLHMRAGLGKTRFLMEYPPIAIEAQHYLSTTAHFGKEIAMASGPYAPPPEKKMNSMKPGETLKNIPPKYYYLVHWLGHNTGSSLLINQGTKGCEYPLDDQDNEKGDKDLWEVPVVTLRSKYGSSSWSTNLVISQSQGVLPSLTEFHMIKEAKWGLGGNVQNYHSDLLPDCKLSRTTVRKKIDSNPMLRRALNISAELYQMSLYHRDHRDLVMEPSELYAKLLEKGYNMELLLGKTRGWWKPFNDRHPLQFVSTMDLLLMARGEYFPYWMEQDKQSIKPEYVMDIPYEFN